MRICPICGHEDAECWRNLRWSLYQQYAHIDELKTFDPQLAVAILATNPSVKTPYNDGTFCYMITRTNHVRRMAIKDFVQYGGFRRENQIESWRYADRIASADLQTRIPEYEEEPL